MSFGDSEVASVTGLELWAISVFKYSAHCSNSQLSNQIRLLCCEKVR